MQAADAGYQRSTGTGSGSAGSPVLATAAGSCNVAGAGKLATGLAKASLDPPKHAGAAAASDGGEGAAAQEEPEPSLQGSSRAGGAELVDTAWDFIIGSDLIYNEDGVKLLPKVIAGLAGPTTTVLYCHTFYRYEMMDYDFLDGCAAEGLIVEEVVATGDPPPPPPVPVMERFQTLFNDHRIAVLKMKLKPKP